MREWVKGSQGHRDGDRIGMGRLGYISLTAAQEKQVDNLVDKRLDAKN